MLCAVLRKRRREQYAACFLGVLVSRERQDSMPLVHRGEISKMMRSRIQPILFGLLFVWMGLVGCLAFRSLWIDEAVTFWIAQLESRSFTAAATTQ